MVNKIDHAADLGRLLEDLRSAYGPQVLPPNLPKAEGGIQARSTCLRLRTSTSTTSGSASVLVSPSWSGASSAILRRMRRMILPLRVFGKPGAHWMWSMLAMGPISLRTWSFNSFCRASLPSSPPFSVT